MADVLTPTQKIDGAVTQPNTSLYDLSRLDSTTKVSQAKATDGQTASDDGHTSPLLASLQIVDTSNKTQVADAGQPAAVAAVDNTQAAAATNTQIADAGTRRAAADDCDKSTACSFTPTTDREKSKEWWDARAQRLGIAPEKDANCMYTVKFGDDLSTIAQRQLQSEGKAVNSTSLKEEQAKLIRLNDAQYKSLDCNPHFLKAGWRLNLNDTCTTTPEVAPAPAPVPAPVESKAPCPDDAPPPPPRAEDCDNTGRRATTRLDAQHAEHLYEAPPYHIRDKRTGCPYDVPPGKSIIYDNPKTGCAQMITVENPDGSRPAHSEIVFGVDRHGNQYNLSAEQKQAYYAHFDCNVAPSSASSDYQGAVVDNRRPVVDNSQAPQWQEDSSGQYFYHSQGHDWYRDEQNRDYFRGDNGRNWYEDQQQRPFYIDQGHCWYEDQQGRDYFPLNGQNYFRDQQNPNQFYFEDQGRRHTVDNRTYNSILQQSTIENFYGANGPARAAVGQLPHETQGRVQDRYSKQEQVTNEAQAQHDEKMRRDEATHAAERTAPPAAPATQQKHIMTSDEIEALPPEKRTAARTQAMHDLSEARAPQVENRRAIQEQNRGNEILQDQKTAETVRRAQAERTAREQHTEAYPVVQKQVAPPPPPVPVRPAAPAPVREVAPPPAPARPAPVAAAPPRPAAPPAPPHAAAVQQQKGFVQTP